MCMKHLCMIHYDKMPQLMLLALTYTEAKKKVCIYVHLFYEETLNLNGIKSLIDLSFLHLFYLLLKSHDYKVIINA